MLSMLHPLTKQLSETELLTNQQNRCSLNISNGNRLETNGVTDAGIPES